MIRLRAAASSKYPSGLPTNSLPKKNHAPETKLRYGNIDAVEVRVRVRIR